eukprot:377905_1
MTTTTQSHTETLKSTALQLEISMLKQKNKTLSDLCAEYCTKYRALISKTTMIELQNKSLQQALEEQAETNRKNSTTAVEYSALKLSTDTLHTNHSNLLLEHNHLKQKYKTAQKKLNSQIQKLNKITRKSVETEVKYNETQQQLHSYKNILNQQNITIQNLKAELELHSTNNNHCNSNSIPHINIKIHSISLQTSETLSVGNIKLSKTLSNSNTYAMVDANPMFYSAYSYVSNDKRPKYISNMLDVYEENVSDDNNSDFELYEDVNRTRPRGKTTFYKVHPIEALSI